MFAPVAAWMSKGVAVTSLGEPIEDYKQYDVPQPAPIGQGGFRCKILHVDHFGEKRACRILRGRLGWFVKGLPNSSKFRESVSQITTRTQVMTHIDVYAAFLENNAHPGYGCEN